MIQILSSWNMYELPWPLEWSLLGWAGAGDGGGEGSWPT